MPGGAFLWATLVFIVGLSLLVFIHELGHYLAARSVGVKVEAFSIGFGKELFGWYDKQGTRWKICMLPLGGYVQMYAMTGEHNPEDIPEDERKGAFMFKKVWQRAWVVFAGPMANFLFAIVALAGLFAFTGEKIPMPVVGQVAQESPAERAGLVKGDTIEAINGQQIATWADLTQAVRASDGETMTFIVARDATNLTLTLTPEKREVTNILGEKNTHYMIGIGQGQVFESREVGAFESVKLGVTRTYDMTATIASAVWRMLTLQMSADIGGPLTIAKVAGDSAADGMASFIMFLVFISINLGLINLFPIPVLDGGHLVYFAIEAIKGKPLGERAQEIGYKVGLSLIVLLMAFAFYKDIIGVVLPAFSAS